MDTKLFSKMLDPMLAGIDLKRLAAIKAKYGPPSGEHDVRKYLDQTSWVCHYLKIAMSLGLHKKRGLKILDIGSGPGYFPYVCHSLGHKVVAVDAPDNGLYDALIKLFAVQRMDHEIAPRSPLPDFGMRFDLITAMDIRFDLEGDDGMWNRRDWETFLSNLSHHQLAQGGNIHLTFTERSGDRAFSPDVRDMFDQIGVNVDAESMTMTEQVLAVLAAA